MNTALAQATCTLNGQEIPCSEMPRWIFALPVVMFAVFGLAGIFWLVMLIDAIKNQKEDRLMWVLIIVGLNILGAILYYFMIRRKRGKMGGAEQMPQTL